MWGEAIRVAIVGFSIVFGGLCMLAVGIKIMSFFCRLALKKPAASQPAALGGA
jgi:Na+-transporting methylmalonyl-CoA/oxaloacetate decarboxylase gamma subunit